VDVKYMLADAGMLYEIISPAKTIDCHILIPKDVSVKEVYVNGIMTEYHISIIGSSVYADFTIVNSGDINTNKIECFFGL